MLRQKQPSASERTRHLTCIIHQLSFINLLILWSVLIENFMIEILLAVKI
jgi:hypothetical protein